MLEENIHQVFTFFQNQSPCFPHSNITNVLSCSCVSASSCYIFHFSLFFFLSVMLSFSLCLQIPWHPRVLCLLSGVYRDADDNEVCERRGLRPVFWGMVPGCSHSSFTQRWWTCLRRASGMHACIYVYNSGKN